MEELNKYTIKPLNETSSVDFRSTVSKKGRNGCTTIICLNVNCEYLGSNNVCSKNWIRLNEKKCMDYKGK